MAGLLAYSVSSHVPRHIVAVNIDCFNSPFEITADVLSRKFYVIRLLHSRSINTSAVHRVTLRVVHPKSLCSRCSERCALLRGSSHCTIESSAALNNAIMINPLSFLLVIGLLPQFQSCLFGLICIRLRKFVCIFQY